MLIIFPENRKSIIFRLEIFPAGKIENRGGRCKSGEVVSAHAYGYALRHF